eukprot:5584620-Karenia_brevis.AAC.1
MLNDGAQSRCGQGSSQMQNPPGGSEVADMQNPTRACLGQHRRYLWRGQRRVLVGASGQWPGARRAIIDGTGRVLDFSLRG